MIIFITGGASGLGEAITRKIASGNAHKVYFTYCNSESNAKKIELDFPNAFSLKCDFRDENEVKAMTEKIAELNIDVLVNNAYSGKFIDTYFHKSNPNAFEDEFKINIVPTIKITQAAINFFRKKKYGKIVTILTSALLNTPPVGASVYVASKAYLEQLTKVWATENIKFNITSNSISPSLMLTQLTGGMDERVIEQIVENHPLKKLLTPDEAAESVAFLINSGQQINGLNIVLNAGTNLN